MNRQLNHCLSFALLHIAVVCCSAEERAMPEVDFSSQIKPLLSDRCYKCHGPDDNARVSDFRLDVEDVAFSALDDGSKAIVKGDPKQSVAWQRTHSNDPDLRMPPPDSNLSLSADEKALITEWIRQGAQWQTHWSFVPPHKAPLPETFGKASENPIDRFIAARLKQRDLMARSEKNVPLVN